jgi:amino acid adenylation domain-containing protein/non-ribosomal peptide synthase protein (TIGR01720 family)
MNAYVAPISHAQRRLWFLDRFEPGNAVYHIPVAVRLRGRLDTGALADVLRMIEVRHDALRTTFAVEAGEPVQVVHDEPRVVLESLAGVAESDVSARLGEAARAPFDLARGPLWRAQLIRCGTGADVHVLLVTLHHIIADGWSLGVLVDELTSLYRARVAGQALENVLPELPIQLPDYTDWQREELASPAATAALAAWGEHLRSAPTALELPTDRVRPPEQSYRGALLLRTLPKSVTAPLASVCRRTGATPFMVLLSAYALLLSRWSRQSELLIGTPVAGRLRSEAESLIGFLVNTLVLRARLEGSLTFADWVARMKAECVEAFGREQTPFDQVVDAVQPTRDRSRTPLFQVYFTVQNAPRQALDLPGLQAEVIEVDTGTAKVDLTLALEESADGWMARWEYCTDLFAPETIARLADAYEVLLGAALAQPEQAVAALPLLDSAGRAAVLALGGGAVRDFTSPDTLWSWFARQSALTPDRIALTDGAVSVTYAEALAQADRVGRRLRAAGVTRGALVGLCSVRSAELVIGILGILRAGAAYLPLDPAYPIDRLQYMLGDAQVAAVIVHGTDLALPHPCRLELASLVASEDSVPRETTPEAAGPEDAAYVIYTSGSTGRPKGCVVTHANVVRLMLATEPWYGFDEDDVWTLFHSYAFDFSVWEIWGALLYGGRLVVVRHEVSRSPEAFHDLLQAERVTVLNQTPSAFRQLQAVDELRPTSALALRTVIFGGEALEPRSLLPWFDRHGDACPRMINMYGITETTVHVTYRWIRRADALSGRGSVIGERIPDLTLYVVDERLEPVPVGVPGELLVGGAGLAGGYLNRAELTAERFVRNPFGPGRLYRSGDLARWLADGDLEYLGRMDQQVKIRGFRIELGEIERVLAAVAGVRDAVVLAREDRPGERRLVAYLVPEPGAVVSAAEAREACRTRLADYMVPAAFVMLERLPLTDNGKLDRRALPIPDASAAATAEYQAPESPAERALAEVWSRVLGVPTVGTGDNFFALGGDSILTIQVVSLAAKAGWKIAAKDLFAVETLAELAAQARPLADAATSGAAADGSGSQTSDGSSTGDVYSLSPMQSGMLFQSVYAPDSGVYVEQVWGEMEGALRPAEFRAAWNGLLERHPGLRSRFHWRDVPEPRQETVATVSMPWRELDWTGNGAPPDPSMSWATLLAEDRVTGFDFGQAPLMRFLLVRTAPDRWRWLWSHHHILLDGWCLPLVFRDVLADYESRCGAAMRPPSVRPYRDYIDWLARQDLDAAEAFWRGQLIGFAGAPDLRLPRPRVAPLAGAPGEAERALSLPESDSLRAWARSQGLTLNTLFQGAWALLLQRLGLGRDIVFGVTVAGRPAELAGVEEMIGLFINTLPLRVAVRPETAVLPWLKALQQAQAEARQFEHTPLASIQGWSEVGRGQSLFESILVFENYPGDEALRQVPSSLRFSGLQTREQTNFPLTAAVVPGQRLNLRLAYDAARFAPDAMDRLLEQWQRLVIGLTAPTASRLADLDSLAAAERMALLEFGQATQPGYQAQTIIQLVEREVRRAPVAPALLGPGREVSYADLWERAGRVAMELQRRGVKRGAAVALCLDKNPELVVAMVGVLRAGAFFLPVDPQYARERIAGLLDDARPVLLLVDAVGAARVPAGVVTAQWRIDAELGREGAGPKPKELPIVSPQDVAYLIYTSGSTGRPKGVLVENAGLANLAETQAAITRVRPGQRVLQFASISFDASVSEIFLTLAGGAALWLEPRETVPAPEEFARQLRDARIDHATLPPALLAALRPTDFPGLHTLLMAGEAASPELYRAWSEGRVLFNAYGPTETSVCATMEEIATGAEDITLGLPIANLTAYVVDDEGELQPLGVPGEIWVGGVGVARGYLGRPDLTAERFVPDPRATIPGARAYRTGDLGRVRPDGRIEFLGRVDDQVKIRGFRVEPGEIEAVLAQHPAVAGALVIAAADDRGGKYLVGYALAREGESPEPTVLRAYLAERLPDYFVPRHVIVLTAWPLNASGKVDRRALPPPTMAEATTATDTADHAPLLASDLERLLASIWREVLHVPEVRPEDNFFELGGDSILSLQIVARAHQAGYALTPRQIFASPTIRGQAAVATRLEQGGSDDTESGDVPLTPIQHWFFAQEQPDAHHWNQSIVLDLRTAPPPERIARALAAVVERHGAFRLRFQRGADGAWVQRYAEAAPAPELAVHPIAALEAVATQLQASLDLAKGPLWRAAYFVGQGGESPKLFLTIHHLVVDGVSWRILASDLASACAQAEAGGEIGLSAPNASFASWSRALGQRAQTADCGAELAYWRAVGRARGELPRDRPVSADARAVAAMERVSVELDAEATRSLLREASAVYRMRADEVLLTALASTLAEWTGRSASVISLENHGREALGDTIDVSRTVGWFTSLYPFRLELPTAAGPREQLIAVKESLRAVPHHGTGFGLLSRLHADPAVRTELAALPSAELCFNYLGQTDHTLGPDAPFGLMDLPVGPDLSPRGYRVHLIDINALVTEGRLRIHWLFSNRVHSRLTIERLAERFVAQVRSLLAHCLSTDSGAPTPSDFTHVQLEASELDALLADLADPDPR